MKVLSSAWATAGDERSSISTAMLGLMAAIIGAAILVVQGASTGDRWKLVSAVVFSLCLVALHLASTLYHSARDPQTKARLKVVDHCAIYLLIAGTYTPFTLLALRGPLGWRLFAAVWTLAALGVMFKLFTTGRLRKLSTLIYVAMGWLVLVAIRPVIAALDGWTFGWLLAGGLFYTLGTLFYHRPALKHAHAVWHMFVNAGGACHAVAVFAQLAAPA